MNMSNNFVIFYFRRDTTAFIYTVGQFQSSYRTKVYSQDDSNKKYKN